jgi:hypothetical protein
MGKNSCNGAGRRQELAVESCSGEAGKGKNLPLKIAAIRLEKPRNGGLGEYPWKWVERWEPEWVPIVDNLVAVGIVSAIGEGGSEEVNRKPTEWWGNAHGSLQIRWGDDGDQIGPPLWRVLSYGWDCQCHWKRRQWGKEPYLML